MLPGSSSPVRPLFPRPLLAEVALQSVRLSVHPAGAGKVIPFPHPSAGASAERPQPTLHLVSPHKPPSPPKVPSLAAVSPPLAGLR
jgi:hypothetical protein